MDLEIEDHRSGVKSFPKFYKLVTKSPGESGHAQLLSTYKLIMKKTFHVAWTVMVCATTILLGSCKRDDDLPEFPQPVVNEPEEITTVELHFTDASGGQYFHFSWSDPDGPGGNDPTIEDITLDSGTVYDVEVEFLDASGDEVVDITSEIKEEGGEHIICFEPEGDLEDAIEITRTDSDGTYEIGLESSWNVKAPATGELHVMLKHQTDGVKDGTCDPGETDVEVHFDITIQ